MAIESSEQLAIKAMKSSLQLNIAYGRNIQVPLSKAQKIPIVGPAIISPIKIAIGLIQAISGLLGSIITSPLWCSPQSYAKTRSYARGTQALILHGLTEVSYALCNMTSLGLNDIGYPDYEVEIKIIKQK